MPNSESTRKPRIMKKSVNKENSSQSTKDVKEKPNFRLIGSQISLTTRPRSENGNGRQTKGTTGYRGKRPMSAIPTYGQKENYAHDIMTDSWMRPQSADIPYSGPRSSVSDPSENEVRKELGRNAQQIVKQSNKFSSKYHGSPKDTDEQRTKEKENILFLNSKDTVMQNAFGETYTLPSSQLLDKLTSEPLGRTWTESELKKCCEDLGMKHLFNEKCEIESISSETSDELCNTARSLGEQIIALARHPDHSQCDQALKLELPNQPNTRCVTKSPELVSTKQNENHTTFRHYLDTNDLQINPKLSSEASKQLSNMNDGNELHFSSDMPILSPLTSHEINSYRCVPTQSERVRVLLTNDISNERAEIKFQQWIFEKDEDKVKSASTSRDLQDFTNTLFTEHTRRKNHMLKTHDIYDSLNFACDLSSSIDSQTYGKERRQAELCLECLVEETTDEIQINNSASIKLNKDNSVVLSHSKSAVKENQIETEQCLEKKESKVDDKVSAPTLKGNALETEDDHGIEKKELHDKDKEVLHVQDNVNNLDATSASKQKVQRHLKEVELSNKNMNIANLASELIESNETKEIKPNETMPSVPDSIYNKAEISNSESITKSSTQEQNNKCEGDKQKSHEKKSNMEPLSSSTLRDSEMGKKGHHNEVPVEVYRQILEILEDEEAENAKIDCSIKQFKQLQCPSVKISHNDTPEGRIIELQQNDCKLRDILTYLDEVEKDCDSKSMPFQQDAANEATDHKACSASNMPRLEELLKMGTVDLANQVLSLCLQLEEKTNSINLLQKALSQQRELSLRSARNNERDMKKRLKEQKEECEAAVRRHQKFIDQLIADKKMLSNKCESLVMELKTNEERHAVTLKAVEERHTIELQKAKEMHAAAEKLRRERWIDNKTTKIKEMTVKGLEPELQRMTTRHQQELADLRMIHKQELDELELRATRKTSQQLEQLRDKLLAEKEEALAKEREILKQRLEKQIEEEERMYQEQRQKLLSEVRREKEHLAEEEVRMRQELEEAKQQIIRDKNKIVQRKQQEHQEALDACIRRQQNELKAIKESLEIEKEAWIHNYKKQQELILSKKEIEIREQYKRERDREIEAAIDRLEKEATQSREELEQATEHRLRRIKEKFEAEVRDLESSERSLKLKLSEAKNKLVEKEDEIINFSSKGRHLEKELEEVKKIADKLSKERADIKEIIRKEFINQIMDVQQETVRLREEIAEIKARHEIELIRKNEEIEALMADNERQLQQVYNRVKRTVTKKDDTIEKLKLQYTSVLDRCSHLEQLLEQQRRDFLLD